MNITESSNKIFESKKKSVVGTAYRQRKKEKINTENIAHSAEKVKQKFLKVLIACEESQRVCIAFRLLGHEAYSCDIQPCSGGYPEWHIQADVLPFLNGNCFITTMNGVSHYIKGRWDIIIAHPPCTYLSNVATRSHSVKCNSIERINQRTLKRIESEMFFMKFINADCDKIAVENPVGVMNTVYRKPDQIIHPYFFANGENDSKNYVTKTTCLWLKGLPLLTHNDIARPDNNILYGKYSNGKNKTWEDSYSHDPKIRSKTFLGIAEAMAKQWGG